MGRAVLVAISIPIFTSQLEKARQATDAANLRAAYAEAATASLDNNGEGGDSTTGVKIVSNGKFDKMSGTEINGKAITSYLPTGTDLQIMLKRNASSATAERLFHF